MFTLDFLAACEVVQLLKPTTCATAQTSAYLDLSNYEGRVMFLVNSTKGTDNDEVLTPTLVSDEASGGAYATTEATLETILGGNSVDKVVAVVVESRGPKRYVKVVLTPSGTTPAHIAGVTAIGKRRLKS